jgi:hypothetical protein
MAGMVVLLLGVVCAGLVYWFGTRPADLADDPAMARFNRSSERQMEMLYGQMGLLTNDLMEHLKQPSTQAAIIIIFAAIVAVGCFYFARLYEEISPSGNDPESPPSP